MKTFKQIIALTLVLMGVSFITACDFSPDALAGKSEPYYPNDYYDPSTPTAQQPYYPLCGTQVYMAAVPVNSSNAPGENLAIKSIEVDAAGRFLTVHTLPKTVGGKSIYPTVEMQYSKSDSSSGIVFGCNASDGVGETVTCLPNEDCTFYDGSAMSCGTGTIKATLAEIKDSSGAQAFLPSYISTVYGTDELVQFGNFASKATFSSLRDQNAACRGGLIYKIFAIDLPIPMLSIQVGAQP